MNLTAYLLKRYNEAQQAVERAKLVKKVESALGKREGFDGENDVEQADTDTSDPSVSISFRLIAIVMIIELIFLVMSIYYVFMCHQETSTRILLILGILFIPLFSPIFVIYSVATCGKEQLPPPMPTPSVTPQVVPSPVM